LQLLQQLFGLSSTSSVTVIVGGTLLVGAGQRSQGGTQGEQEVSEIVVTASRLPNRYVDPGLFTDFLGISLTLATTPIGGSAGTVGFAARGGAAAVRVGQAGEAAVRAAVDIGQATRITVNGATRVPDGLTARALSEVKNVGSLSYTQQLRDFAAFAQQTGRQFDLYVRPSTQLSGPLLDAIRAGQINLRYIP
jgi:hypothetical protein